MNQLQLEHNYTTEPDKITVKLNNTILYSGNATVKNIDFLPKHGINILTVSLDHKSLGNFFYNPETELVEINSTVVIKEIIVESRYFRNLVIKCSLVEVDIEKNLAFPSKYINHENVLTMEGSEYMIKFEYPIKHWMQIHKHGRNLKAMHEANKLVKDRLST